MLTLTLRGLERDGLVTRTVFPTIPPRVDYELTELGRTLKAPLNALADWARSNRTAVAQSREKFDRKTSPKATRPYSGKAVNGAPASRSATQ